MKEETKKKLCKISKIVGFAITFGFAVFGVLCAAVLIGNGSKKDEFKTLDSSLVLNEVRTERTIKPRKAPDFNPDANLFTRKDYGYNLQYVDGGGLGIVAGNSYNVLYSAVVDKGLYYYKSTNSPWHALTSAVSFNNSLNGAIDGTPVAFSPISYSGTEKDIYVYVPDDNMFFVADTYDGWIPEMYFVDTAYIPPSSSVYLGENWNPLKAFGDILSPKGGYLIRNQRWVYGTYTNPSITLNGFLFKYEGQVFDRINIGLYPLNATHSPYVDSSGNVVSPSDNEGSQEIYALQYVTFSQSWNVVGQMSGTSVNIIYSVPVLSAGKADTPVGGKYPYNGSVLWASDSRTIEVIDDKGITGDRFDDRFLGMTDLELVKFLSQYQSEAIDVVNTGGMFSLFTNAFSSLMPILSISILPNITLGMILFIPLVGGIIVVIIRLVKK